MENFNLKPQNKIEKESNDSTTFEALKAFGERFGKSLKDSATAISLVLATFSYTEAQAQKTECATQTIKLKQEESIQLDHHKQTVDSLSDVLFEEAKNIIYLQLIKKHLKINGRQILPNIFTINQDLRLLATKMQS